MPGPAGQGSLSPLYRPNHPRNYGHAPADRTILDIVIVSAIVMGLQLERAAFWKALWQM